MRSVSAEWPEPTRVASPMRQQLHASQNECAHQNLAQFGVCLHESETTFTSELDNFSILPCANPRQRTTARKRVHFASALAGSDDHNKRFGGACRPPRVWVPRNDYEEWNGPISLFDQDLTTPKRASVAVYNNTVRFTLKSVSGRFWAAREDVSGRGVVRSAMVPILFGKGFYRY